MKKKIIYILITVVLLSITSGCLGKTEKENQEINLDKPSKNNEVDKSNKSTLGSDAYDKFNRVKIGMSRNEVKAFLITHEEGGIEEYSSFESGRIDIFFDRNDTVSDVTLRISLNDELFVNAKTDLSKANEYVQKVKNNESITYKELVAAFKTEGICTDKNNKGCYSYRWTSTNGSTISIMISSISGYIISIFGSVK